MARVEVRIARRPFVLDGTEIQAVALAVLPEPLVDHYVVIAGRRYPPKQVIALATGLDRADFTTHQARGLLRRLGFTVGRRSDATCGLRSRPPDQGRIRGDGEAEVLRPYLGQWVAQKDMEVMVAADTPEEVLAWLERHDQYADGVFRVPGEQWEMEGVWPG